MFTALKAIAISLNTVIAIALLYLFFLKVVGWPIDLTVVMVTPMILFFAITGVPVSIAANERYNSGRGLGLSSGVLTRFGLLGILAGTFSVSVLYTYLVSDYQLGAISTGRG